MRRLEKEEVKTIQIDILLKVAKFCEIRNIKYSLYGGTLLGAIRHKGYIPWDDDIDISMPRPEYERFIKEFYLIEDQNLKLHEFNVSDNYPYTFMKVSDERTVFEEHSTFDYKMGIHIDIFPIDGLPEKDKDSDKLFRKNILYRKLIELKTIKIVSERSWYKNMILAFSKILFYPISIYHLVSNIINLASKYEYNGCEYVGNVVWGYGAREKCMKRCYNEYILVEFEGHKFKSIIGYDEYLSNVFGDYFILPSLENRKSHHKYEAYVK